MFLYYLANLLRLSTHYGVRNTSRASCQQGPDPSASDMLGSEFPFPCEARRSAKKNKSQISTRMETRKRVPDPSASDMLGSEFPFLCEVRRPAKKSRLRLALAGQHESEFQIVLPQTCWAQSSPFLGKQVVSCTISGLWCLSCHIISHTLNLRTAIARNFCKASCQQVPDPSASDMLGSEFSFPCTARRPAKSSQD